MRRSDDTSPFDHEQDTRADLTQEFWGVDSRDSRWSTKGDRSSGRVRRVDDTGSMRAIREGVAAFRPQRVELRDPTGQVLRTRSHGAPRAAAPSPSERPLSESRLSESRANATIGDLAAGHFDGARRDRDDDLPLTPVAPPTARVGLGAVDPLLARLGALLLIGVLLVPLALALRPASADEPDTFQIESPTEQVGVAAGAAPAVDTTPLGSASPDPLADAQATAATAAPDVTSSGSESTVVVASSAAAAGGPAAETSSTDEAVGDVAESVVSGIADAATVDAAAERLVPECPQTYTAVPGDSWYGIADAAGVSPAALMAENRATVDTVILAGDDVCLPSGATVPTTPATTTVPTTPATTAPTDTTSPTTAASPTTTEAPTTTVASTTPSGSPGTNASVDEVKAVIRSIFPESEWDTAFAIADRESGFVPTAFNGWCCYGVFQIYWNVHQRWLDDLGITSSSDLYDPLLNVRAAHAIWQRSGNSWRAWSTYDG
jgi:LysM repeat protein